MRVCLTRVVSSGLKTPFLLDFFALFARIVAKNPVSRKESEKKRTTRLRKPALVMTLPKSAPTARSPESATDALLSPPSSGLPTTPSSDGADVRAVWHSVVRENRLHSNQLNVRSREPLHSGHSNHPVRDSTGTNKTVFGDFQTRSR